MAAFTELLPVKLTFVLSWLWHAAPVQGFVAGQGWSALGGREARTRGTLPVPESGESRGRQCLEVG